MRLQNFGDCCFLQPSLLADAPDRRVRAIADNRIHPGDVSIGALRCRAAGPRFSIGVAVLLDAPQHLLDAAASQPTMRIVCRDFFVSASPRPAIFNQAELSFGVSSPARAAIFFRCLPIEVVISLHFGLSYSIARYFSANKKIAKKELNFEQKSRIELRSKKG